LAKAPAPDQANKAMFESLPEEPTPSLQSILQQAGAVHFPASQRPNDFDVGDLALALASSLPEKPSKKGTGTIVSLPRSGFWRPALAHPTLFVRRFYKPLFEKVLLDAPEGSQALILGNAGIGTRSFCFLANFSIHLLFFLFRFLFCFFFFLFFVRKKRLRHGLYPTRSDCWASCFIFV
jgi:hypothetical protein